MSGNQLAYEEYAHLRTEHAPRHYWVLVAAWETDAMETPQVGTLVYGVFERKPTVSELLKTTGNVVTTKDAISLLSGQTIINSEDVVFDLYSGDFK
jgi:hypothetical protein